MDLEINQQGMARVEYTEAMKKKQLLALGVIGVLGLCMLLLVYGGWRPVTSAESITAMFTSSRNGDRTSGTSGTSKHVKDTYARLSLSSGSASAFTEKNEATAHRKTTIKAHMGKGESQIQRNHYKHSNSEAQDRVTHSYNSLEIHDEDESSEDQNDDHTINQQNAKMTRLRGVNVKYMMQSLRELNNEETKNKRRRIPSVIHIGVRKTCTTALLHFLSHHPQVKAASHEVHFFDLIRNFQKGIKWYVNQMPVSRVGDITFEKTPSYYEERYAFRRLHSIIPNVKLILSVREPVKRAISDFHFSMDASWPCGFDRNKFTTFEEYAFDTPNHEVNEDFLPLKKSVYSPNLKKWLTHFNISQFYIFDGDALVKRNPAMELARIEEFMGIEPYFRHNMFFFDEEKNHWCLKESGCLHFGGKPHPEVNPRAVWKLRKFFAPFNQELFELAGKEFKW